MAYSPRWNIFDQIFDSDSRVRVIDDVSNSRALIEIDNATVATFNADGLTLANGASINEFTIDGTLIGNSDDAVPTEQAVKTYVDNKFASLAADRITQDDSRVQVVDDGTNTAYVEVVINTATVGTWTSDGLTLAGGTSINEFSTDGTLSGDSDDAVPTEQAVKTYVDTEIGNISTDQISEGDSYVEVVDTGEGYVTTVIDGEEVIRTDGESTVFSQDVSISGDLFVDGTTFVIHNQQVTTSDNIIVVNDGETGPGVTAGTAGMEVDRGTEPNYQFIFSEDSDTFRIGEVGDTQAVATREDVPVNLRVPWWNDTEKRFDTAGDAYITIDNVLDEVTMASGDSYVRIGDDGTATGYVEIVTDGVQVAYFDPDASTQRIGKAVGAGRIEVTDAQISMSIATTGVMTIAASGVSLQSGTSVNEFSIDGTLLGNSDNVIPTEKAVKTYVDNATSGISLDKIYEGDSYVEVVDDGTSTGYVTIVTDGVEVAHFDPSSSTQRIGKASAAGRIEVSDTQIQLNIGASNEMAVTSGSIITNGSSIFDAGDYTNNTGSVPYLYRSSTWVGIGAANDLSYYYIDGDGNTYIYATATDAVIDIAADGSITADSNYGGITLTVYDYGYLGTALEGRAYFEANDPEGGDPNIRLGTLGGEIKVDSSVAGDNAKLTYTVGTGFSEQVFMDIDYTYNYFGSTDVGSYLKISTGQDSTASESISLYSGNDKAFEKIAGGITSVFYDPNNYIEIGATDAEVAPEYITMNVAASTVGTFTSEGLTLASGASINEFSTDGTLVGNSDDAVPTEKAVKTYVDQATGQVARDKIYEGDSYVEVVDDGTASGYVTIVTDGVEVAHFDPDSSTQRIGKASAAGRLLVTDEYLYGYIDTRVILDANEERINLGDESEAYVSIDQTSNIITVSESSVVAATFTEFGLTLTTGATVNEFSTDGTLSGNSDSAIPTEKAVKAYVDASNPDILIGQTPNYMFYVDSTGAAATTSFVQSDGVSLFDVGDYTNLSGSNNYIYCDTDSQDWIGLGLAGDETYVYLEGSSGYLYLYATETGANVDILADTNITAYAGSRATFGISGSTYFDADDSVTPSLKIFRGGTTIFENDGVGTFVRADSNTFINVWEGGKSNPDIRFYVDTQAAATLYSTGLYLSTGATVNEFSTDGTLTDNSDSAVPTEQAVKTYVDTSIDTLREVKYVSSDTTAVNGEILLVDTTAGDVNIDLFEGVDAQITIKKITSDSNSVIVSTTPGTIDGLASKSIDAYNSAYTFVSDGSDFYII
jgi:hypothetical protein